MRTISRTVAMALSFASVVVASPGMQTPAQVQDIRSTGEYTQGTGDTPESAKKMSQIDARLKAIEHAALFLKGAAEVKSMGLTD